MKNRGNKSKKSINGPNFYLLPCSLDLLLVCRVQFKIFGIINKYENKNVQRIQILCKEFIFWGIDKKTLILSRNRIHCYASYVALIFYNKSSDLRLNKPLFKNNFAILSDFSARIFGFFLDPNVGHVIFFIFFFMRYFHNEPK